MWLEVFDKQDASVSKHPYVTTQRKEPFSFNRIVYELLGKPEAVELLYDRERERVGFRATSPEQPQAFPLRPIGKNAATFVVAGQALLQALRSEHLHSPPLPSAAGGQHLALDLRGDSVEVTGPRARSREDES